MKTSTRRFTTNDLKDKFVCMKAKGRRSQGKNCSVRKDK